MKRKKSQPIELPSPAEEGSIEQTTIYPTIDAMFAESVANLIKPGAERPWFEEYSRETRRTMRFVFFRAVTETLRLVSFRMNFDQDTSVFDELGKEALAFDRELQNGDDVRAAAILGLSS